MSDNLILRTDSYKASHFLQYPPHTTSTMCYLESRGGRFDKTVFFGLQYILDKYLMRRITAADVDDAEAVLTAHGVPFNRAGWTHVVERHDGCIPLKIRAVPEGSVVPTHNVLMTVESTDPELYWLPNYFEALLERVWYPTTVATLSWHIREIIYRALLQSSSDPLGEIPFKLHDFGARGVSSAESAALGDVAHLVSFQGTDTLEGLELARRYYYEPMAGFSIPASEHSTMTAWGQEDEPAAFENMVTQFGKPGKLFACVSDSYDLWRAVDRFWGTDLRQRVIDSGATLVIRPDSGDPVKTPMEVIERLDAKFGHTLNQKGFRVLNHVRVIQGDGVNIETIEALLKKLLASGYSATNIAFGSGGALLQKVDRDTQKFAYKLCHATIGGKSTPVFKDPVTDPGKRSKAGRLDLVRVPSAGSWRYETGYEAPGNDTALRTVYETGENMARFTVGQTLAEIRKRAWPC